MRTEIHNSNKNAYWEVDIYENRFFLERRMNVFGPHKPRIIGRIEVEKGREVLYLFVRPRSFFTGGLLAMIILSIIGVITLNLNLVFFFTADFSFYSFRYLCVLSNSSLQGNDGC